MGRLALILQLQIAILIICTVIHYLVKIWSQD